MLSMGPVAAGRKVETAAALASRLPLTLAAMSAGDLDSGRATIIATELREAGREPCAAVQAQLFPAVLAEAPGAVTKRVPRVLARVDPDAVRLRAAKERLHRFVRAYPSRVPGMSTWVASLPAAQSAACWAAIEDLAHRLRGDDRRDGHCRFPGCRRDARRCEPDHVIAYSRGGPSAIWNLASLCKHHHRVKHEAGRALTMSRDGECIWTDHHGRQYATHPVNHHDLAA
jgi:hypothetical protein